MIANSFPPRNVPSTHLEGRCAAGKAGAGWTGSGLRGGVSQGWARAAARSLVRPSSLATAIGFM
jgi:hypothetical protein